MNRIIVLVFTLIMLTGCGPVKIPVQSTYVLGQLQPAAVSTMGKTPWTLSVSEPVASPGYRTSDLIYVALPYQLKSYANNRWVSPPAQMFGLLVVQALQERFYFRTVASPPFLGVTDYRLDMQLLKLQQEFMTPVSQVRLVVQVSLVNNATQTMVASRRFEAVAPAPANDPYSGVVAANKAAEEVSHRIAAFCVRAIQTTPSGPLEQK